MDIEIDKLTLIGGADIPVPALRASIKQPIMKELSMIGEKRFFKYLSPFRITRKSVELAIASRSDLPDDIDKDSLVKSLLGDRSDFELFMQVLHNEQEAKLGVETILTLLMPDYTFEFDERFIIGQATGKDFVIINDEGFKQIQEIIEVIFCLNAVKPEEFNPEGDRAKAIAEKLTRARERVRISKGESDNDTYLLANYISNLGIGPNSVNLHDALNFTVFQLFNQMHKFGLKTQSDHGISAMLAGAKDVEVVDWLVPINP